MLGMDERALRVIWTIFLFGLLLAVVYYIRETILVFAVAIFFAYMLSPIVALIERFIPRKRTLALAIVYVLLIGALTGIGFALIPTLANQATSLATRLPALLARGKLATLPLPGWLEPLRVQIIAAMNREASNIEASVVPFIQETGTRILSGLGYAIPVILIPILAFFFLKDGREIRTGLLGTVDAGHDRTTVERILDDVHDVLRSYIRALVLLALASFTAWVLFLSIMGYQYELLLAGLAGVLEFFPVVGPAAALVIMLIVCGVTGSGSLLWIVVFWACYRVFQDYMLNPYLMSSGVELHPLLVLFGIFAGERIAGIPGMFFSIPAIAILRAIYGQLRRGAARTKSYPRHEIPPATVGPDYRPNTDKQILE
jgi:predicted PurR-regulated permease PerM